MESKNLPRRFGCALNIYAGLLIVISILLVNYVEGIPAINAQIKAVEASVGVQYDFIGIIAKVILFTILIIGLYRLAFIRKLIKRLSRRFGEPG